MTGASYGAGNYGMCGRGYDPRFVLSWPYAQTGVMGPEQAALTMTIVAEGSAKRRGQEVDREKLAAQEARIKAHFEAQSSAFYTSGQMLDDGVIDPRDSRNAIGFMLGTVREAARRELKPTSFGVARM